MPIADEIKKWVTLFSPALALVPGVNVAMPFVNIALAAVGEAEQTFGPGTGKQKFQHAVNATADAINIYNAASGKNFNTSEMMGSIEEMVNAGVRFCNAMGAFKHKD